MLVGGVGFMVVVVVVDVDCARAQAGSRKRLAVSRCSSQEFIKRKPRAFRREPDRRKQMS